ncbi:Hypothetical protein PBC10988_0140 [Planctomycetales bacterium 10988]|nr:Hypothetical protein PBC10988_0140 [Planctomycetales bacterium 10988]
MHAKLIVVEGKTNRREIELELPMFVGRRRDSDLVIMHKTVSRQHCELYEEGGQLIVRDNSSANGTYINNRKISQQILKPGDKLKIGPITFLAEIKEKIRKEEAEDDPFTGFFEDDNAPPAEAHAQIATDSGQFTSDKAETMQMEDFDSSDDDPWGIGQLAKSYAESHEDIDYPEEVEDAEVEEESGLQAHQSGGPADPSNASFIEGMEDADLVYPEEVEDDDPDSIFEQSDAQNDTEEAEDFLNFLSGKEKEDEPKAAEAQTAPVETPAEEELEEFPQDDASSEEEDFEEEPETSSFPLSQFPSMAATPGSMDFAASLASQVGMGDSEEGQLEEELDQLEDELSESFEEQDDYAEGYSDDEMDSKSEENAEEEELDTYLDLTELDPNLLEEGLPAEDSEELEPFFAPPEVDVDSSPDSVEFLVEQSRFDEDSFDLETQSEETDHLSGAQSGDYSSLGIAELAAEEGLLGENEMDFEGSITALPSDQEFDSETDDENPFTSDTFKSLLGGTDQAEEELGDDFYEDAEDEEAITATEDLPEEEEETSAQDQIASLIQDLKQQGQDESEEEGDFFAEDAENENDLSSAISLAEEPEIDSELPEEAASFDLDIPQEEIAAVEPDEVAAYDEDSPEMSGLFGEPLGQSEKKAESLEPEEEPSLGESEEAFYQKETTPPDAEEPEDSEVVAEAVEQFSEEEIAEELEEKPFDEMAELEAAAEEIEETTAEDSDSENEDKGDPESEEEEAVATLSITEEPEVEAETPEEVEEEVLDISWPEGYGESSKPSEEDSEEPSEEVEVSAEEEVHDVTAEEEPAEATMEEKEEILDISWPVGYGETSETTPSESEEAAIDETPVEEPLSEETTEAEESVIHEFEVDSSLVESLEEEVAEEEVAEEEVAEEEVAEEEVAEEEVAEEEVAEEEVAEEEVAEEEVAEEEVAEEEVAEEEVAEEEVAEEEVAEEEVAEEEVAEEEVAEEEVAEEEVAEEEVAEEEVAEEEVAEEEVAEEEVAEEEVAEEEVAEEEVAEEEVAEEEVAEEKSPRKKSPRKKSPRKKSPRKKSPRKKSPRKKSPRKKSKLLR